MGLTGTQLDLVRYGAGPFIAFIALLASLRANHRSAKNEEWRRLVEAQSDIKNLLITVRLVPLSTIELYAKGATRSGPRANPNVMVEYDSVTDTVKRIPRVPRDVGELLSSADGRFPVAFIYNQIDSPLIGAKLTWYGRSSSARSDPMTLDAIPPKSSLAVPFTPRSDLRGLRSFRDHLTQARIVIAYGDSSNHTWWRLWARETPGPGVYTDDPNVLACWLDNTDGRGRMQYAAGPDLGSRRRKRARKGKELPLVFWWLSRIFLPKCNGVRSGGLSIFHDATASSYFITTVDGHEEALCWECFNVIKDARELHSISAEGSSPRKIYDPPQEYRYET